MNILVPTPEFMPVWGGVGTYVIELCKRAREDFEIHIVTPCARNCESAYEGNECDLRSILPRNVSVHHLGSAGDPFFRNFLFQMNFKTNLRSMLKKYRIDLIHTQSEMPDFLVSPKSMPIPILTTVHTTFEGHVRALESSGEAFRELKSSERFARMFGPFMIGLENGYYRSLRYYLTVSHWGKTQLALEKNINLERIHVIHNGVDGNVFSPSRAEEARERYPRIADVSAPKVLYLSRFATRKGIHLLIKAIPRVLAKVDAHFVFAGGGELPRLDISNKNYTNLGYLPQGDPPLVYSLSDAFILPSFYENFPISILEAMASRCAVVATRVCGIPEMIRDQENGLLISPHSVDEIEKSLVRLIEDDVARKRMSKEARRTAIEGFSWDSAAQKTYEHYERVIGNFGQSA